MASAQAFSGTASRATLTASGTPESLKALVMALTSTTLHPGATV